MFNEQLNQLAITAQQHPPQSYERQVALRRLVNGILQSGRLCYPQRGQFASRYDEIYAEAVQDLLLYVCQNIHKYDASRASVMGWVNMLMERRFFQAAIPQVIGKPSLRCISLDAVGELAAAPHDGPKITDLLKASIESDPDNLFKNEHLEGCPAAHFQAIALKRLEGKSWQTIAEEFGRKTGSISSFYSRCLKKFTPKLQEYCAD